MKQFVHGFTILYDKITDTLYISLDKPKKASSFIDENYIIVRKENNQVCGITIDGYKERHDDKSWKDSLILEYLPSFRISDLSNLT